MISLRTWKYTVQLGNSPKTKTLSRGLLVKNVLLEMGIEENDLSLYTIQGKTTKNVYELRDKAPLTESLELIEK